MLIIMFILYVLLSAGGLILFKLGTGGTEVKITSQLFSVKLSWILILGIIFYACSFVLWLLIVNSLDLSYAMPLSVGFVNLTVLIGSWLVLHENITFLQWVGVFIIIIGLYVINVGS